MACESSEGRNGGSDPSWLNLAFLGRPDFPSRGPKILLKLLFGGLWTEKWGTTDLTPHLRPSEELAAFAEHQRLAIGDLAHLRKEVRVFKDCPPDTTHVDTASWSRGM